VSTVVRRRRRGEAPPAKKVPAARRPATAPSKRAKGVSAVVFNLTDLYVVRCSRCGRAVGRSSTERPKGILCTDPLCTAFPPATDHDVRDAAITMLGQYGLVPARIGEVFKLTRQRVNQVLASARGEPRSQSAA
jgi:hypothetical protein